MKRYAVHPGYVMSKYDGQRHYVGFYELCRLYGVDPFLAVKWDFRYPQTYLGRKRSDYIHLYPRERGDYDLEGKTDET